MKLKKVIRMICVVLLVVVFAVSSGFAEKMRLATPLSKTGSVGKGLKKFADLVQEKSQGRIETSVSYAGELGTQREQVEMLHDGSLEVVTTLASGTARYVPQLGLLIYKTLLWSPDYPDH